MKKLPTITTLVAAAAIAVIGGAGALPGTTERVSVDSNGVEGNDFSFAAALDADASSVAFLSNASNLIVGDTNGKGDIFVHDRDTGQTTRVSVSSAGAQANQESYDPKLNADARYVVFASIATNLVAGDTNGHGDVFVHDRQTGETTRVSVSSGGVQANDENSDPTISADGRYVAFTSTATNLVPGDTNGNSDVFVHDRDTGETTRVSVSSSGAQANGASHESDISDDGNFVAFGSRAGNLTPGDTNGAYDAFVHDRQTGQTTRVSVTSAGGVANKKSDRPVLSSDGSIVAFDSKATNLVPGDTNDVFDVFVHDRQTGVTTRVSVWSSGAQGNKRSYNPELSGDGLLVSFNADAKLEDIDTNGVADVYVHNRQSAQTTLESVSSSGVRGNRQSVRSSMATDGSFVGFGSTATNLVPDDTNGVRDIFVHELAFSS